MTTRILIFLSLMLSLYTRAQNLVPNGSFETKLNCPNAPTQFTGYCEAWYRYTERATPDYFDSCSNGVTNVPVNIFGNIAAHDGSAYAGLVDNEDHSNYREYISCKTVPLQPGATYEVTISAALADVSAKGSDGLGVYFYRNGPDSIFTWNVLSVQPQVSYSAYGPLTGNNWVRLTGTFVADSAYNHLVIGGFKDTNTIKTATAKGKEPFSYYYIDSVVVKKIGGLTWLQAEDYCAGQIIDLEYEVFNLNLFAGNTFIVQLSDSVGSFINATDIGTATSTTSGTIKCTIPANTPTGETYRMRIISTNVADTFYIYTNSGIYHLDKPVLNANSPVPQGETILLEAITQQGVTHQWTGPMNFSSAQQNPIIPNARVQHSGVYTLTINMHGCEASANIRVEVQEIKDTSYFILYPNLNDGQFYIEGYTRNEQQVQMRIVNSIGQVIYKLTGFTKNKHLKTQVILPYVADGTYFLHLRADGRTKVIPFTVKH